MEENQDDYTTKPITTLQKGGKDDICHSTKHNICFQNNKEAAYLAFRFLLSTTVMYLLWRHKTSTRIGVYFTIHLKGGKEWNGMK